MSVEGVPIVSELVHIATLQQQHTCCATRTMDAISLRAQAQMLLSVEIARWLAQTPPHRD